MTAVRRNRRYAKLRKGRFTEIEVRRGDYCFPTIKTLIDFNRVALNAVHVFAGSVRLTPLFNDEIA